MESRRREDAKLSPVDVSMEETAKQLVDCAFHVHQYFGPGMLESIYERALQHALKKKNIDVRCQVKTPVYFDGELLEDNFRVDMIVNNHVLVEIKACENILPIHRAQTLSYMRLCNLPLGFLINFNVPLIKNGIVRIIDERFASSRLGVSGKEGVL